MSFEEKEAILKQMKWQTWQNFKLRGSKWYARASQFIANLENDLRGISQDGWDIALDCWQDYYIGHLKE